MSASFESIIPEIMSLDCNCKDDKDCDKPAAAIQKREKPQKYPSHKLKTQFC